MQLIYKNFHKTTPLAVAAAIVAAAAISLLIFVTPAHASNHTSNECGGVEISVAVDCRGDNAILSYLGALIRFMAAGIGLIITLMIVVSGIQYIASAGNPEGVAAAKKKLMHAIEALLLFIFAAAIMNFVIPGGIL